MQLLVHILKPIWFSVLLETKSWLQLYSLNFISDFIRKPLRDEYIILLYVSNYTAIWAYNKVWKRSAAILRNGENNVKFLITVFDYENLSVKSKKLLSVIRLGFCVDKLITK